MKLQNHRLFVATLLLATAAIGIAKKSPAMEVGKSQGEPRSQDRPIEKSIQAALDRVNSQCPKSYPEIVVPLPEEGKFGDTSTAELMRMLESWNPALRTAAAGELGRRGDGLVPTLRRATRSDNWTVRAGSTSALAAIVNQKMRNWQETYPAITDPAAAMRRIKADHADLADDFIRLTRDPRLEVRVSALSGMSVLALQNAPAATAVLELCADDDNYLAQDAMITLEKRFGVESIQQDTVISALKVALGTPLPRGRGHVLRLIDRMDADAQRQFIPELLAHLDWQPNRDTMFGAGGQEEAVRILTELNVKELIPRIPRLMNKTMRGPGLFEPCLKSIEAFGKDAKTILPELRENIGKLEQDLSNAHPRSKQGIEQKLSKLRKAVDHVESL